MFIIFHHLKPSTLSPFNNSSLNKSGLLATFHTEFEPLHQPSNSCSAQHVFQFERTTNNLRFDT